MPKNQVVYYWETDYGGLGAPYNYGSAPLWGCDKVIEVAALSHALKLSLAAIATALDLVLWRFCCGLYAKRAPTTAFALEDSVRELS